MKKADVIIIGAGLMGVSTALFLAKAGKKVILLEKESSACHASAVNAGGVRSLNRAMEEIPISIAAMEMWPQLSKIVDDNCGFQPVGQVRIATDKNALNLFEKRVSKVEELGFYHEEVVTATEIKKLVPAFTGHCKGGIISRLDGQALPAQTLKAFSNTASACGANFFTRCKVINACVNANGFKVFIEDGRMFESEIVINCSGAWSKTIAGLFGDYLPIKPEALSMMVTARMPRFIEPVIGVQDRKLSFKQMANGTVVIGGAHRAFLDMQKEKTTINFHEVKKSSETVLEYFPIMNKTRIVRCWAGIEGFMSDGLPVIDQSKTTPGFFHVCGFSAHGFQLSPMIGKLVCSLVLGKKPELSLDAFSINRFKKADQQTSSPQSRQ
ncbi:FAD-binding oxidoreductase [bacterium]|nr:FAD-binding oxidoreductase [bacterium]